MSAEQRQFQTEVSQLLDIVIHSLYSNKEIFLRELISNASDAIDKARYEGITNSALNEGGTDWKIRIIPNETAKTLTVSDNGIGMTRDEVIKSLGTIAHSGTKEFLTQLEAKKEAKDGDIGQLIGQFGVGFYSAFMVADKVTVITRKRGEPEDAAVKWESDAKGSYSVEETSKDTPGTEIILHLREDSQNFLREWEIRRVVTTYSDYIEHPVVMDITKPVLDEEGKPTDKKETSEEVLNSRKALWLKDKGEITPEEYTQFYKHITHDFSDPLKTIQFKAEGLTEFYALLFIPSMAPFDMFREHKYGPMLYVKRVQIMENCEELIPQYLRFIKGVVESSDLPLNISREILQNNAQISRMNKNITRKVLDTLAEMQRDEPEKYKQFYREFGKVLKEGIHTDFERKEAIAKLCLFESTATKAGETTTFDEYISRMKAEQKDIYFITGGSRKELENSPYLEGLKMKDYEVLFMTDEVDDLIFSGLGVYQEKPLKSVLKGNLNLDKEVTAKKAKTYEDLLGKMKEVLKDKVEDVRLTTRLKNSPVCLVVNENAMDPMTARFFESMGQTVPQFKPTLEINPDHALIKAMRQELTEGEQAKKINEYATLLYDQAVLMEGGKLDDPAGFVKKISAIMANNL